MSVTRNASTALNRRRLLAGAAAVTTAMATPAIVRAQGGMLKVGVLLPRSGAQAGIGQDCYRGVELANPIFKSIGLPELEMMNADTETNVEVARSRAEKLIADGAQLLVGAFDSGQSSAIAQVAEQKGIPFVINIAAAPPITEQGYKFVFRNFPTAGMILSDAFANQKAIFEAIGRAPQSGSSCTLTIPTAFRCRRASTPSCRSSTCPTKFWRPSLTIRRRAISPSKWPRPRPRAPRPCSRSAV